MIPLFFHLTTSGALFPVGETSVLRMDKRAFLRYNSHICKGLLAQLVEHRICNAGVAGSNPARSTIILFLESFSHL